MRVCDSIIVRQYSIETLFISIDMPINVGWGSKQTQFHGSLGKTAAQATPKGVIGMSPDDDALPRISWRGDGTFFVVSVLSLDGPEADLRRRTLRMYDRRGVLQSTAEDVAGLEHAIAWRPSGNLIMSTQRFGFEGGGAGPARRHDVVFFERNGLRHGEFSLRVDEISVKGRPDTEHQGSERNWGYKVRELAWNSDSSVLAVWIEGDMGDVGEFLFLSNVCMSMFSSLFYSSILDYRELSLVGYKLDDHRLSYTLIGT